MASLEGEPVAVADGRRRDPRISRRASSAGHEVFVVDVPGPPAAATVEVLDRALVGAGASDSRCRLAQRVQVDDAFFELTVDELVDDSRPDDALVVSSRSQLAGIRTLPETADSMAAGDREESRLRTVLCGQT